MLTTGWVAGRDKKGSLLLIERIAVKKLGVWRVRWRCLCDCGTRVIRGHDYLKNTPSPSCGCTHRKQWKAEQCPRWKGCGELSGAYFSRTIKSAKRRGIEFRLSINQLWQLFVAQEGKCALTGLPLRFGRYEDRIPEYRQTASLDRIDSEKGYIQGNVWWVHKDVNLMKNELTLERFVEVCRLVTEHARRKHEQDEAQEVGLYS